MIKERYTAVNLRYLVWRAGVKRRDWIAHLASWAGCSEHRAAALLRGAILQDKEQKLIAQNAGCTVEEIQTERFWEDRVNILSENLKFLTDKEQIGEKLVEIAKESGIGRVTLSRWKSGKHEPEDKKLAKLIRHFKLNPDTNLRTDPIFLSLSPVGELMRKEWLRKQIEHLDTETLHELFPAFERLLKDS